MPQVAIELLLFAHQGTRTWLRIIVAPLILTNSIEPTKDHLLKPWKRLTSIHWRRIRNKSIVPNSCSNTQFSLIFLLSFTFSFITLLSNLLFINSTYLVITIDLLETNFVKSGNSNFFMGLHYFNQLILQINSKILNELGHQNNIRNTIIN